MRVFAAVSLIFLPMILWSGNLNRIRKAFEKNELVKAEELIKKALLKEPFNPGVSYFYACLFSKETYIRYNLDSAKFYIKKSLKDFKNSSAKLIVELEKDRISEVAITDLNEQIRDTIYYLTAGNLTIEGVNRFLNDYPQSIWEEQLIFKRDSMEFLHVQQMDTQEGYQTFVTNFGNSSFMPVALDRLDELRYDGLLQNDELASYYQFLTDFPDTKFRNPIETYIFKKATATHTSADYQKFYQFTSLKHLKKKVADILYYMEEPEPFEHPNADSLKQIKEMTDDRLFPVIDRGLFGFHAFDGRAVTDYKFNEINYKNKCVATEDDWLFVYTNNVGQIVNKRGRSLIMDVEDYVNSGHGVASVKVNGGKFLYHKSGFRILNQEIEDAEVLKARWIKVKSNGKWGLVSYSGLKITEFRFDEIYLEGDFWVFERNGSLAVYTEKKIEEDLYKGALSPEFKFDDIELVNDQTIIGFRDDRECMLNESLEFLIPWGQYVINPDESGWYLKSAAGYRLYHTSEQDIMNEIYPYLETNKGWLALRTDKDWMLVPRKEGIDPMRGFDSLKLINDFSAIAISNNTTKILFASGFSLLFEEDGEVKTFDKNDDYILIDDGKSKFIYDGKGRAVITGTFEEITFFNDTLLKVIVRKKYGLMALDGTYLLDPVYDALDERDGLILCLKRGQIGCYDLQNHTRISPEYESRIKRMGSFYLAKKGGKYGIIDGNEKVRVSFDYDEINFWNDTSYLAKKSDTWGFLNHKGKQIFEKVENMQRVVEIEGLSVWKYIKNGRYGLISNQDGILLDPEFTDIFNIGSEDQPLFFADQHLDKAGYHVVSYIDRKGRLVLSKAYRNEEFDKILCDD